MLIRDQQVSSITEVELVRVVKNARGSIIKVCIKSADKNITSSGDNGGVDSGNNGGVRGGAPSIQA